MQTENSGGPTISPWWTENIIHAGLHHHAADMLASCLMLLFSVITLFL